MDYAFAFSGTQLDAQQVMRVAEKDEEIAEKERKIHILTRRAVAAEEMGASLQEELSACREQARKSELDAYACPHYEMAYVLARCA